METSFYQEYIDKWKNTILAEIQNNINGTDSTDPNAFRYFHREWLTPVYSVSGMWESVNTYNNRAMVDYVALNSPLPVKKRGSYDKKVGEIAKLGGSTGLNEKQMKEIRMILNNARTPEQGDLIVPILFGSVADLWYGVLERNEATFLEGLSTGVALIEDKEHDEDNIGIGIRLDYGYHKENKAVATGAVWSDKTNSKPLTDLRNMVERADDKGRAINYVLMDHHTLDDFLNSEEVKKYVAWRNNYHGKAENIQSPILEQMNNWLLSDDKYGFEIIKIKRKSMHERNGNLTPKEHWKRGMVVGVPTLNLGTLQWSDVEESFSPVAGVDYTTRENGVLISMYRQNRPILQEFTDVQAVQVPIIGNVKNIYTIDTTTIDPEDIL